jgi:Protein of unknown function (DUF2442)
MSTSTGEPRAAARAMSVSVTDDELIIELVDGRRLVVPLAWYPRLLHGTSDERKHWEIIGRGVGIHWPELDEDISVEHALAGVPSGESAASLERWYATRRGAA